MTGSIRRIKAVFRKRPSGSRIKLVGMFASVIIGLGGLAAPAAMAGGANSGDGMPPFIPPAGTNAVLTFQTVPRQSIQLSVNTGTDANGYPSWYNVQTNNNGDIVDAQIFDGWHGRPDEISLWMARKGDKLLAGTLNYTFGAVTASQTFSLPRNKAILDPNFAILNERKVALYLIRMDKLRVAGVNVGKQKLTYATFYLKLTHPELYTVIPPDTGATVSNPDPIPPGQN